MECNLAVGIVAAMKHHTRKSTLSRSVLVASIVALVTGVAPVLAQTSGAGTGQTGSSTSGTTGASSTETGRRTPKSGTPGTEYQSQSAADIDSTAPGFDISVNVRLILPPEAVVAMADELLAKDPHCDVETVLTDLMNKVVGSATRRCAHALTLPIQEAGIDCLTLPGARYLVDGPCQHIGTTWPSGRRPCSGIAYRSCRAAQSPWETSSPR